MNGRKLTLAVALFLVLGQAMANGGSTVGAAPARQEADAGKLQNWIAMLGSPDANQRAEAACSLGQLGERADAAVPALARLLGDEAAVSDFSCGNDRRQQQKLGRDELTVGKVVAVALAQINGPAVDALLTALGDANWVVRRKGALPGRVVPGSPGRRAGDRTARPCAQGCERRSSQPGGVVPRPQG
jgi:hypothetical protein